MKQRIYQGGLIVFLLALTPLAKIVPEEAAWENGLLEHLQIAVLCVGFFSSCLAFNLGRDASPHNSVWLGIVRRFALVAMPIWLLCIGRETSWGATVFTSAVMENEGPSFSSKMLWYHFAVKPLVSVTLFLVMLAVACWRLDRSLVILVKQNIFPWLNCKAAFAL